MAKYILQIITWTNHDPVYWFQHKQQSLYVLICYREHLTEIIENKEYFSSLSSSEAVHQSDIGELK